jgi:hypothetical protein
MNRLDRRGANLARRLGEPINTGAVIILGVYTLLWGIWIANPWWSVFNHAMSYSWLAGTDILDIPPEYFWGFNAIIFSGFMIYGVVRGSHRSLTHGAFAGFIHWALVSVGFLIGDWQTTEGITALMVSFYCAYVYLNLMINKSRMMKK